MMTKSRLALAATLLASASPAQAGGRYGGRGGGAELPSAKALEAGLAWLKAHQNDDGSFSASQFFVHDPKGAATDGIGGADQDTTVTAWTLLAFLGAGHSAAGGKHQDTVERAVKWLLKQQRDDGMIGAGHLDRAVHAHALACYALAEAFGLAADVENREPIARALDRLIALRLENGSWAHDVAGKVGDYDATLAATMALCAAQFFRLPSADLKATPDALATLAGDRPTGGEAVVRFFLGQDPKANDRLATIGRELGAAPLHWPADPKAADADLDAWVNGTLAAYQFGGKTWQSWVANIESDLLPRQRQDGSFAGSWDPIGPRGKVLGRVGCTAMLTLLLESYCRYTRIVR